MYLPMQELQETQILSLGQADPLEKEMATHSTGFLSRKSHVWWRLAGLQSTGSQRVAN